MVENQGVSQEAVHLVSRTREAGRAASHHQLWAGKFPQVYLYKNLPPWPARAAQDIMLNKENPAGRTGSRLPPRNRVPAPHPVPLTPVDLMQAAV